MMNKKDSQFTEVYSDFYVLVYNTVCQKVSDLDIAEDITQNVFILYYNKMDEVENIRKWLFSALRFEVSNYFQLRSVDDLDIAVLFEDISLTFVNGFRDARIILENAVESIVSDLNRVIFDMVAVRYYTYPETARVLGLTVRQVKYRYHEVVKTIQEYLKSKGIESIEELL